MHISVSLIEGDREILRELVGLIEKAPGFCCAGIYLTATQAIQELPHTPADVVILGPSLQHPSGIECVRTLKGLLPHVEFVVSTQCEDSEYVLNALRAGATGYLLEKTNPETVLTVVREVHEGGSPMCARLARRVLCCFQTLGQSVPRAGSLTAREEQVIHYVAEGHANKEIAELLSISPETVRSHLKNIYEKLHVHSRTAAVAEYLRDGDLSSDPGPPTA